MSENKRRHGKSAAMLAFAASLLAANAVSVMAAAEETSGSDVVQNPNLVSAEHTGSLPAYNKITDNVYSATRKSFEVKAFYDVLNKVKDFGVYANTANSSGHFEGNSCVGRINTVEQRYNACSQTMLNGKFTTYFETAPSDETIKFSNLPDGTKFELVLG